MGYKPVYESEADRPPAALARAAKAMSLQAGLGGTLLVLIILFLLTGKVVTVQPLAAGVVMLAVGVVYTVLIGRMEDERRDLRLPAAALGGVYLMVLVAAVVWLVVRLAPVSGGFVSYVIGLVGAVPVFSAMVAVVSMADRDLARWLRDAPAQGADAADPGRSGSRPGHLGPDRRDPRGPFA